VTSMPQCLSWLASLGELLLGTPIRTLKLGVPSYLLHDVLTPVLESKLWFADDERS
jgi:hypothetical protein